MELELKKECLDTYELGEPQTLTQEETAETIVPDYCPDIARIISVEGVVCLTPPLPAVVPFGRGRTALGIWHSDVCGAAREQCWR